MTEDTSPPIDSSLDQVVIDKAHQVYPGLNPNWRPHLYQRLPDKSQPLVATARGCVARVNRRGTTIFDTTDQDLVIGLTQEDLDRATALRSAGTFRF